MKKFKAYYSIFIKTQPFWKKVFQSIIFWGLIYIIFLILLIFLNQTKKIGNYKVGDLAPKDIVLKRPISFLDLQETEKKKYEAAQNILPVFDFQKNKPYILIKKLEEIFNSKERDLEIPENVIKIFSKHNFSSPLEDTLAGIILQIYQNPVVTSKKYLESFYQRGYIKRNIETKEEEVNFDVFSVYDYPKDLETIVNIELKKVKFLSLKDKEVLAEFLINYCTPNLTLNALETNYRREKAMEKVLPISYNLPKGYMVARKGEVLNEKQIAILREYNKSESFIKSYKYYIGIIFLSIFCILFLYYIIFSNDIKFYGYRKNSTFNTIIFLEIFLLYLTYLFKVLFDTLSSSFQNDPFKIREFWYLTIPFALASFLLRLFSSSILALAFGIVFSFTSTLIFSPFSFFFPYALVGTFISVLTFRQVKTRWDITKIGIYLGIGNIFSFLSFSLLQEAPFGYSSLGLLEELKIFSFSILISLFGGIFTSMLVGFLAPIIESVSGIFSNLKLLELASPNHPLLKELAIKAPGTFQHSLVLANLAERAADKIGCNSLLVRVAALYHDIGKIFNPSYFIENQKGSNPHENLKPGGSRLLLKKHVMEGVELAKKYRLPKAIIDGILMHHGKKIMHYFYQKAKDKTGGADEEVFRYSGPLPDTKEMSLLFLADSIEAASRTIEDPEPKNIHQMVEKIVENAIEDKQLIESHLSFREIEIIKKSFIETITSQHHERIDYPSFEFNNKGKNGNNNKKSDENKN